MGTRLYLGNLSDRVRDRDLERFFKGYGRLRDVVLKNGYGFVEFDDYRDADDAVYELNGKDLLGDRYGPPMRTEYKLIVENLSTRVSWQDLKDHMRRAGDVTFADAHKQYRNEGVVEYSSYSDMKNAIEKLDNTELHGRKIRLVEDKPRRKRSRSRSYSRSRSRSRSRRRSRSRSYSRSRSRSKSRSRSQDRSRSRSKSRSKSPRRNRTPEKDGGNSEEN